MCSVQRAEPVAPGGPFRGGLLHVILTEDAMPGFQHGLDPFGRLHLGDGNQADRACSPPRRLFGGVNPCGDLVQ